MTALGEIGRNSVLLIPADGDGFSKLGLVDNLLARIPSGKETGKVQHKHYMMILHVVDFKRLTKSFYIDHSIFTLS